MLFIDGETVLQSPVMDIGFSGTVIRQLFEDKKCGRAVAAQEIPLFPDKVRGGFYSLPSYLDRYCTAGIKWTSHVKPADRSWREAGPYTKPLIILSDYTDGRPYALIDGFEISAIRTGAVSYSFFARIADGGRCGEKNRLLICGAGHQAKWQIAAALKAFPAIEKLYIWSRDIDHAYDCILRVKEILDRNGEEEMFSRLEAVPSFENVVGECALVIGATSAEKPYLRAEHLREASYVHIGMNDVSGDAVRTYSHIYCDDFEAGKKKSAQSLFVLYREDPSIEERVTLIEDAPERILQKRVMFDGFGLSIFDIGLGCEVYRWAKEKGHGEEIALYSRK